MKGILESYKKTGSLHHAYALCGDKDIVKESLFSFLETELNFPISQNPDFWQGEYNVFKIDDSRAINTEHLNRPVVCGQKIFVLFLNAITLDAQNSLLKMFEEPKSGTTFFIVCPNNINILPTLRSRLIFEIFETDGTTDSSAQKFLKANIGQRMEMITKMTKEIKDEKAFKADLIAFMKEIENILAKPKDRNLTNILSLEKAISYANDESASIKMILEHLAIVL